MFNLWKAWVERLFLGLYNYTGLCPVSTETSSRLFSPGFLYQESTQVLLEPIHHFFSEITDKILCLYPQSTEPITTTTLYKGGLE